MKNVSIIILSMIILVSGSTAIADKSYYKVKKGTRILAFIGKPTSSNVQPVLYYTAINQYIKLFHKRSGPGVYAFYLKGLIVKDKNGDPIRIRKDGFFVVKKRLLTRRKE